MGWETRVTSARTGVGDGDVIDAHLTEHGPEQAGECLLQAENKVKVKGTSQLKTCFIRPVKKRKRKQKQDKQKKEEKSEQK